VVFYRGDAVLGGGWIQGADRPSSQLHARTAAG
jgi:hypothetical protein